MTLASFHKSARVAARLGLLALLVFDVRAVARTESVTSQFSQAQRLYTQGKLKASAKILSTIVRRYPEHQPSHLLLGRIFFRAGRIEHAARHFRRVSLDMLGGDIAYEYGIVMFQAKDCRRAKPAFQRVPSQSRLADLAAFYRGLCHLQARQYTRAQLYLSQARRLPANLIRAKRDALEVARRAIRAERQGGMPMHPPYAIATPLPAPPPPPPVGVYDPYNATPYAAPPSAKKPAPPPAAATMSANATPSLTAKQIITSQNFHGTKVSETETFVSEAKISLKGRYDGDPRPTGGQPHIGFNFDLAQVTTTVRGATVAYKAYRDQPDEIIEVGTEISPTSAEVLIYSIKPEAGFPLTGAVDIQGGYTYTEQLPDMKTQDKVSEHGPNGKLHISGETVSLKATGSQLLLHDAKSKAERTATVLSGDLSKQFSTAELGLVGQQTTYAYRYPQPLPPGGYTYERIDTTIQTVTADATKNWSQFALTLALSLIQREAAEPKRYVLIGEKQSIKGELKGTRTFEVGASLSISAAMEQLSDYEYLISIPSEDGSSSQGLLAKGDGSRTTFGITFKLTPADWLFGSLAYKYSQLSVQIEEKLAEAAFKQATPEVVSEYTLQAGVSKTF